MFFQREEMPSFTPYKRNQSRNCDISYLLQVSKDKKKFSDILFVWVGGGWRGFHRGSAVKNPPAMQEPQATWVQSLGQEDPLEEGIATHSSVLAWRIPWKEEPGGLQSVGLQRVEHD